MSRNNQIAICIAEDRADCEVAVRILIASLLEAGVDIPIEVTFPPASGELIAWAKDRPTVFLSRDPIPNASFWNVKPQALCAALDKGYEHALWIDSDIIVANAKIAHVVELTEKGRFVITEEPKLTLNAQLSSESLTTAWGLPVGRVYKRQINSGVVGCGRKHLPLLHAWRDIIESDAYRQMQEIPYAERPFHAFGDQNVLCALLGSKRFEDLDVAVLREGVDIIQHMFPACYRPGHRLLALAKGVPPLIHSQGPKPWRYDKTPDARKEPEKYKQAFNCELSPYRFAAKALYRKQGWTCPEWIKRRSKWGAFFRIMSFDHWSLAGLPLAAVNYYGSVIKSWAGGENRKKS